VRARRPGEWFIDREAGILYFWPPKPLGGSSAEVSVAAGLFTLADASDVTLCGLTMESVRGHRRVDPEQRALPRDRLHDTEHRQPRGSPSSAAARGEVAGCDMSGMGGGGIYLIGGDRATLAHAGHVAENNHIHTSGAGTHVPAGPLHERVGLRASHNLIHHAPHAAILFGGWSTSSRTTRSTTSARSRTTAARSTPDAAGA
jgi:hypothetical protein